MHKNTHTHTYTEREREIFLKLFYFYFLVLEELETQFFHGNICGVMEIKTIAKAPCPENLLNMRSFNAYLLIKTIFSNELLVC